MSTKAGLPPPPYSPQNSRTPLGVTHWLAAAPVLEGGDSKTSHHGYNSAHTLHYKDKWKWG